MMKVANIIEDGRVAGPQHRMIVVARELKDRVATTLIFPIRDSAELQSLCCEAGVPFRTIELARGSKSPRALLHYFLRFPFDIIATRALFRQMRIEIIHVSGGAWQFRSVIAARLAKCPVVWHLNDTSMPVPIRCTFRLVSPLATALVFASERTRAYYQPLAPTRPWRTVPAVVDCRRFDPKEVPAAGPGIVDRLGGRPVIGTVANINPNKGLEVFLAAFAQVSRNMPEARALIVGPSYPSQKAYHQKLLRHAEELGVAEQVVWAGPQKDVRPILNLCDAYLCSSRSESSPMALWEAMAMARAVVSADVGDAALHISNGENGYITKVGDHVAMAARLLELLSDKDLRHTLGSRARVTAQETFAPEIIAAKTEELYRSILRKKS